MKNINSSLMLVIALCCCLSKVNSQSTTSTNFIAAPNTPFPGMPNYLGWAAGVPQSVDILHQINQPINFHTQAGLGPIWANMRMQIYENPLNPLDPKAGFIGIGNFTTFAPNYLLHQDNPSLLNFQNFHQFTNSFSGNTANDGFRLGIDQILNSGGIGTLYNSAAQLIQTERDPIDIFSNTQNPAYFGLLRNTLRI